jgi:PEP-CTERM motif
MTFSGLGGSIVGPATYVEDGITVTSASGLFWGWPSPGQLHMDPSGFAGNTNTFTFGGNAFNPTSIDISYIDFGGSTLTFSGFDSLNTLVSTLAFTGPSGTLNLSSLGNIFSLRMVDTVGHISVDNFVLSAASSGAVPEPATWAMMLAGFGLMGFALRNANGRRKASQTARVKFAF